MYPVPVTYSGALEKPILCRGCVSLSSPSPKVTLQLLWCPTSNLTSPWNYEDEHREAGGVRGDGTGMNTGYETRGYFDWSVGSPPDGYADNPAIVCDMSRNMLYCGHTPFANSPFYLTVPEAWGWHVLYLDGSVKWFDLVSSGWPVEGRVGWTAEGVGGQWAVFDKR